MDFVGSGKKLEDADFKRAADTLGCEEEAIRAVVHVEARGSGFDARNRPVILPERHVFYRNLSGAKRQEAVNRGLAYSTWQPGRYPKTQDARYHQLEQMMAIDEDAALICASWGIGQVLGENFKVCGYRTVQEFVSANVRSEGGQLDCMVGFILGNDLSGELRHRNWPAFARRYNGPQYAKNSYDVKLETAYRRFKNSVPPTYDPLSDGLLSVGDKGDVVTALQRALGVSADGDFGPLTAQAVRAFQAEHGLTVDGKVGVKTGKMLGLPYWS